MEGSEAAMAAVLRDDDLLREILLCLGFPAFLVSAALVSKRWLSLAADPAFLRRFRERNPPELIGLYINDFLNPCPRFVRVSEAPELRVAARRAGFYDDPFLGIIDCQNGRLLIKLGAFTYGGHVLRNPLCPTRALVPVEPPPTAPKIDMRKLNLFPDGYRRQDFFLSRDSSKGVVYTDVLLVGRKLSVQVYVRRPSGAWDERILQAVELSAPSNAVTEITMPVHGKLYMVTGDTGYIHCLDFVAPRPQFSSMKLPANIRMNFKLSYRDGTGLVLIHGQGFTLSVWHLRTDGSGEHNWVLVYRFRVPVAHDRREVISVVGAGDEAELVFLWLQASGAIVCLDLKRRQQTVYELMVRSKGCITVFPFMTVWPPIFPDLD